MTLYELLLFVHVLAAAAWVGGVLAALALWELVLRANDRATLVKLIQYDDRLGPIYYAPAVLVVLTAGIGLVLEGPWRFSDGWILVGLAILLAALALVFVVIIPATKRLGEAAQTEGVDSVQVRDAIGTVRLCTWIELAGLLVAFFVMTTKPF